MKNINSVQWSVKCRPHKLSDVYGLDKIKEFFYKASKKNEWPNAVLFQAKYGTGKTTLAKIIAQMMVCQHPNENGEPCGECQSCLEIINETWHRDVINLNGAADDSEKLLSTVNSFVATPPFKDRNKVVIIDEVQAMSYQCKSKLLKLTEAPRPNVHYIFTSMVEEQTNSKEKAASTAAFGSRCMVFKFPDFTTIDVMRYLYGVLKDLNIEVSDQFKTYGLQTIAQSADGSLRKATQILQQCIETETYDIEEIKQSFGLESIEDFYKTLLRLMNGDTSKELFNTLLNVNDYDGMVRLSVLAFANAETYRLFGQVNNYNGNGVTKASLAKAEKSGKYDEEILKLFNKVDSALTETELAQRVSISKEISGSMSEWQQKNTIKQILPLIEHKNYTKVRDMFYDFYKDNSTYVNKSSYILAMCRIIDACKVSNSPKLNNKEEALIRRRILE